MPINEQQSKSISLTTLDRQRYLSRSWIELCNIFSRTWTTTALVSPTLLASLWLAMLSGNLLSGDTLLSSARRPNSNGSPEAASQACPLGLGQCHRPCAASCVVAHLTRVYAHICAHAERSSAIQPLSTSARTRSRSSQTSAPPRSASTPRAATSSTQARAASYPPCLGP